MKIALIVAVANNGVIGANNKIPWHCPADLQYFKRITMGAPILMGRKTWQSLGIKPLPGRHNVVISRGHGFSDERCSVVSSIEQGLDLVADHDRVFVMGGAEIYQQLLDRADELFLTEVDINVDGDCWFPEVSADIWELKSQESHAADSKNPYGLTFKIFNRK